MGLVGQVIGDVEQLVRGLLSAAGVVGARLAPPRGGGVVGLGRSQAQPDNALPPGPTDQPALGRAQDGVREAKDDLGRGGHERPPPPVQAVPAFTDRGTTAKLTTVDDTSSIDRAIIGDVPGASQLFGALGFSLTGHDNAAGLSQQMLDYVAGSAQNKKIVGFGQAPVLAVPSVVLRDALDSTIDRLAAVEHVDASKRTELIPGLADSDAVTVGGISGGPSLADAAASSSHGVPGAGQLNIRADTFDRE